MADTAGARIITEDELDSITLKAAIEGILGVMNIPCHACTPFNNSWVNFLGISCFAGNENVLAVMSERALKAARPEASTEIVQQILALVSSSTRR